MVASANLMLQLQLLATKAIAFGCDTAVAKVSKCSNQLLACAAAHSRFADLPRACEDVVMRRQQQSGLSPIDLRGNLTSK